VGKINIYEFYLDQIISSNRFPKTFAFTGLESECNILSAISHVILAEHKYQLVIMSHYTMTRNLYFLIFIEKDL